MKVGLIGNDQILFRCIKLLYEYKKFNIEFVICDERRGHNNLRVFEFCRANSIEFKSLTNINSEDIYSYILSKSLELIFSVSNYWILNEKILNASKIGVINFHNGPPNKYHGINIPSWVIINGEQQHGVMWHFAESEIDSGDVVLHHFFELDKNETALTLTVKCITYGIKLFKDLLEMIHSKDLIIRKKQQFETKYYSKKDMPPNLGYLNFNNAFIENDRLVRGLNFGLIENNFCYAKIKFDNKEIIVNQIEFIEAKITHINGQLVFFDDENFIIQAADGYINIVDSMDLEKKPLYGKSISEYLEININEIF